MAPRLPRLIATLLTCTAALSGAAAAQVAGTHGPDADISGVAHLGRHVVTREMIEEAGLLRLGEVVRLAPGWNATTVDDFTWRAAPRGLAPGAEDLWVLLLDGMRVEPGALGVASLERLPVDLTAIDSIVFVSSPAPAGEVFAPGGSIHIHTHRPDPGFAARGRLGFGSETGDPGPFTFLPGGRLNRDRYGHESAGEVLVRRGSWYGTASYTASVHLPTDPLILPRIYASSSLTPRTERVAPSVRFGFDGAGSRHEIVAGTSRIDDWHRVELAGIELPVRSELTHVTASGAMTESGFVLGYRAGFDRSRIATYAGATAPPFDFEWRVFRGTLEASRPRGARLGVTLAHHSGLLNVAQSPGSRVELGAFAEATLRTSVMLRHHAAAAISGRGDGLEGGATLTSALAVGSGQLLLRLGASRTRAISATGLIDLAALGELWLGEAGITADFPPPDLMMRLAEAELGWRGRAGTHTALDASVHLRAYDGMAALRRDLGWDPVFRAWRGPVQLRETAGRLAGGRIGVRFRPSQVVEVSSRVDVSKAYGEDRFRRTALPVPVVRGIGVIAWRPVTGFGLRAELEAESARRWPDYEGLAAAPGKARTTHPGGVTASLSGWKTFLDGRLRGQFVARNLTGRRVILHPDGRASTLAFLFLLGASF